MARLVLLLAFIFLLHLFSVSSAATVETSFYVANLTTSRLCSNQVIPAVNGMLPGPTIEVEEGDTVVVHVYNQSPYNLTIHWHGVFQRLSAWADGPEYITQCPIQPGNSYTYRFNITGQEGTLWWHAHVQWLRATVHGALIIKPPPYRTYPFPQPYKQFTVLLGEWWNANPFDIENAALATGGAPNISDAFTINGWPGDLYSCPTKNTTTYQVEQGKTYLFRIINAALNNQFFLKVANHSMTVVAVDASYTAPYKTDVIIVAPGQTTDVLVTTNQSPGKYYIAASPYQSASGVQFDNTTTTAIISYGGAATTSTPILPILPAFNDTPTAYKFSSSLRGLLTGPHWLPCPVSVNESLFLTVGLGLSACGANQTCSGPNGQRLAASINNHSFVFPSQLSILQAFVNNVSGIYTADLPSQPPVAFDYTNPNNAFNQSLIMTTKSTSVRQIKYNSTVQIVYQDTALVGLENHPMHLHGYSFYVVGQGFGNFDPVNDPKNFNFRNPPNRNTIGVPVGGWAAIRFRANNPGAWIFHCHLDVHLPWGLASALLVDNGGTPATTLPPPPADLPQC